MRMEDSFAKLLKTIQRCGRDVDEATGLSEIVKDVYGRIVAQGEGRLEYLSSSAGRKTVFLFGEDAITSVLLRKSPYEALIELGLTPEYIHYKFVVEKSQCHVVLFKLSEEIKDKFDVQPATWDGVMQLVKKCYPLVADDCRKYLEVIKSKSCEEFEKEAGIKFLDAKIKYNNDKGTPRYYGYEYYCGLPNRKAWQTRLFLYCEMRLFELFTGNGHTLSAVSSKDGSCTGPLEYISPNISLSNLKSMGVPVGTAQLVLSVPTADKV